MILWHAQIPGLLMWAFAVIDAEGFRSNMEIGWSILLAFTQTYLGRISSTAEP